MTNICHFCQQSMNLTGEFCRDKPDLLIGKCVECNLIQAIDFSHVNEKFYSQDSNALPLNMEAERQRQLSWNHKRIARMNKLIPNVANKKVLDFGCGTGGFLQQGQGQFADIIGFDLSEKVCVSHTSQGWKCVNTLMKVPNDIEIIVLFHVLEHVPKPWELLRNLKQQFQKVDIFVIEVPNTEEALNVLFQCKEYQKNHYGSQHIWYFSSETLSMVLRKAGLKIIEDSQLQRYSFANTLGWLKNNEGGGQDLWDLFNDEQLNDSYEKILISKKIADSLFYICRTN